MTLAIVACCTVRRMKFKTDGPNRAEEDLGTNSERTIVQRFCQGPGCERDPVTDAPISVRKAGDQKKLSSVCNETCALDSTQVPRHGRTWHPRPALWS